jgi:hypothetical protein
MTDKEKIAEEEKKSNYQKFKEYLASLAAQIKERPAVKKILAGYKYVSNTRAYKILTSKAVGRAIGLTTLIAGAAGLMVAAPAALAVVAVGLVTAVAVDTYMTHRTNKLYTEAKLLQKNKLSLDKKQAILEKNPAITKALEGKLFVPNKEGQSKTNELKEQGQSTANFIGGAILSGFERVGGIINGVLTGNPVGVVMGLASAIPGVYGEGEQSQSISDARKGLRNFIDLEQKKDYSPGYNNVESLKEQVDKQRIQTLALEELSKIEGIDKKTPQEIQTKFAEIHDKFVEKANKKANQIADQNVVVKYAKMIFKNLVRAHDPFSKYNNPADLTPQKIQENLIKKEQVKEQKKQQDLKKMSEPVKNSLEEGKKSPPKAQKVKSSKRQHNKGHVKSF